MSRLGEVAPDGKQGAKVRRVKEAMKEHLMHAMRPQGGHGKHERLAREAGRWKIFA